MESIEKGKRWKSERERERYCETESERGEGKPTYT